ncbi:MAG: endonuclease NucS domain-containing protein [Candidatus Binatus sp.]|jgi:hypothetical protein|uniref:endonuclease NucS domain-containing protein n=1 Tax=Candidatus Binatus sp. TaxID=2811406 RepID=UPI003D12C4E5
MTEVEKLIGEGLDSRQIADKLGVPFWSVAGVRSRMTKDKNEASAEDEALVDDAIAGKFGLESDLQEALRANIGQLEGQMKVVDGGKEKTVASGRIDIMAEDKQGNTVVIELKAGTADHKAIGQLLSYMGDLMTDGKPVRGILVAGDFTARALSAARAVPTVQLKKYSFKFSFEAASDGPTKSRTTSEGNGDASGKPEEPKTIDEDPPPPCPACQHGDHRNCEGDASDCICDCRLKPRQS